MDFSIIANIENVIATRGFLEEQKKQMESVYNADSHLNVAQKKADALMKTHQRKPMVIEYYKEKGKIESVEMYINPQKLNISTQKVKSKAYTRGGIFYHHWGDDHWNMQLSGTVGLAGMKGIEQLEKIYHYSGTLLRYKNAGPTVINNGQQQDYYTINYEDPFSTLDYIISNNVDDKNVSDMINKIDSYIENNNDKKLISQMKSAKIALELIKGYNSLIKLAKNNAKYSDLYVELNSFINNNNLKNQHTGFETVYHEAQKKVKNNFIDYHPQLQILIAFDLTRSLYNMDSNSEMDLNFLSNLGENLSKYSSEGISNGIYVSNINSSQHDMAEARIKAMKKYIQDVQDYNNSSKLSKNDVSTGLADIDDELNDEWRPRQVFIYFEDRVYIGHFDNFSWSRVAETPLIQYDMRLTITRQIIVTSNSANRKKPVPTELNNRYVPNDNNQKDNREQWVINLENYAKQAKAGNLKFIQFEILRAKAVYHYEEGIARNNGETMTKERKDAILRWLRQVRETTIVNGKQLIPNNDPLYGESLMTGEQYLYYFSLWSKEKLEEARELAEKEIKRIKSVVDKENGKWTSARKNEVKQWLIRVMNECKLYHNSNYIEMAAILNISN